MHLYYRRLKTYTSDSIKTGSTLIKRCFRVYGLYIIDKLFKIYSDCVTMTCADLSAINHLLLIFIIDSVS